MKNAEAAESVIVLLRDLGVLVAQDIVYNGTHLYLDRRTFEAWRLALAELKHLRAYDLVLAGHGEPATPAVYAADCHEVAVVDEASDECGGHHVVVVDQAQ